MHIMNVTQPGIFRLWIICANLALTYRYKNLKTKLYNCNANMFFHKECLRLTLVPNYVNKNLLNNTKISNTMFKTIQVLMWKHQSTVHWVRFVCFLCGVIGHTLYSKKKSNRYISYVMLHDTWFCLYVYSIIKRMGVRGGAVCWGTAVQAGRSRVPFPMVSLEFFIDIILPVALCPWGWLSL